MQSLFQVALNSNLILLIRRLDDALWMAQNIFKFQSDSINTAKAMIKADRVTTLNSNLILLIPGKDGGSDGYFSTLNSNLILLIQTCSAYGADQWKNFKFQSDSINTQLLIVLIQEIKKL